MLQGDKRDGGGGITQEDDDKQGAGLRNDRRCAQVREFEAETAAEVTKHAF